MYQRYSSESTTRELQACEKRNHYRIDNLERIMVLGALGAGKTCFSIDLSKTTSLPIIHLDREFLLPGYAKPDPFEWLQRVQTLAASPRWIMDGNYFDVVDCRLARADIVFHLDLPQSLSVLRIVRRMLTNFGKVREDTGLRERFHFLHLVHAATYKFRKRSKFRSTLKFARSQGIPVIRFKKTEEIEVFLRSIATSYACNHNKN
jgi:adenylate kinase family enzyme